MSLFVANRYRGKLIVVEGIDGSGKSTQISLLSNWLRSQGYAVSFSEWNSSPLVVALGRILGGRDALKYYEAGMDLGLARDVEESFRIFQGRILDEYDAMAQEVGFHIIDATQSIEAQQMRMREIVMNEIGADLKNTVLHAPIPGEFGAQPSTSPVL